MKKILIVGTKKYDTKSFYDITMLEDNDITVNYSEFSKEWSHPGTKAYTLQDTGDGFVFTDHFLKQSMTFDYGQAEMIMTLLSIVDKDETYHKIFCEDKKDE